MTRIFFKTLNTKVGCSNCDGKGTGTTTYHSVKIAVQNIPTVGYP